MNINSTTRIQSGDLVKTNTQTREKLNPNQDATRGTPNQRSPADEFHNQIQGAYASGVDLNQAISEVLARQLSLVRTPGELSTLRLWRAEGKYKEIDRWLDCRLRELKKYWKHILRVPHHRVAKPEVAMMYEHAAYLKESTKLSWSRIARDLFPEEYKADAARITKRLQQTANKIRKTTIYV
jgi:hypothetical protein